jgi:hypothetical protein
MNAPVTTEQCVITRDDEINITARQVDALKLLRDEGEALWGVRSNVGGSRRRMFLRMKERGYVEGPPFKITDKGRKMVARFYD